MNLLYNISINNNFSCAKFAFRKCSKKFHLLLSINFLNIISFANSTSLLKGCVSILRAVLLHLESRARTLPLGKFRLCSSSISVRRVYLFTSLSTSMMTSYSHESDALELMHLFDSVPTNLRSIVHKILPSFIQFPFRLVAET